MQLDKKKKEKASMQIRRHSGCNRSPLFYKYPSIFIFPTRPQILLSPLKTQTPPCQALQMTSPCLTSPSTSARPPSISGHSDPSSDSGRSNVNQNLGLLASSGPNLSLGFDYSSYMMPSQQIASTRGMNTEMMNHQYLHQPQMYGRDPFRRRSSVARAPRMKWTSTLHSRFVHAVELLGGHESATGKSVFELMNVKDLNLVQVRSHLQWYRTLKRNEKASGGSLSSSSTESDNGVNLELTLGRPN